jgi:DNA (cytosine-5)-methyltransferase 1
MNEKTHLDLFSGIGGFALAAKWNGYRTVGFCDNEPYAQAVLKKHWPDVPCHKDIREVRGELYAGVTLLTGGFPCQPFSVAGKQRGKDDNRYLWPEMCRVIREARPAWIIGENVAGIVNLALDTVCADLEAEGYEVESVIIPACAVDAPHRRDRVWIVANSTGGKRGGLQNTISTEGPQSSDQLPRDTSGLSGKFCAEDVANSQRTRLEGHGRVEGNDKEGWEEQDRHVGESGGGGWQSRQWLSEPNVGRVAHGIPNRVVKLRGLGNAIVPQVAAEIIRCINKVMEDSQ